MRKSTRRKVWRTDMNPVYLAVLDLPTAKEDLIALLILEAEGIARLQLGAARPRDVWFLERMVETARAMANAGIGPEALPSCDAAQLALNRIEETPAGAHLADVHALSELHRWHQAQREAGTAADYRRAAYVVQTSKRPRPCPSC